LVEDLNKDGRDDLIITTYYKEQEEGFVFVYEVPNDFPKGVFRKHIIASGFRASDVI
ncbi:unnamed protein product, partial [Allacma fusca]